MASPSRLHLPLSQTHTKLPSLPLTHTSIHQSTSATGLHTPASTATPHLPHLSHASRLTPPSLSLIDSHKASITHSHTPASISRHLPPASTCRRPQLLHIPHTYSLSRLTASTPHKSASAAASTCRPPHTA